LNGVSALTPIAGGGFTALLGDVKALAGALRSVAGNGAICLVAAIEQAVALEMSPPGDVPYPVFASSTLAAGTVVAVASQALATIVGVPEIEASGNVAIQESTTPTGDLMTGGPIRSVYQTDTVSLRLRLPCSWATRGAGVAYVTGATW